MYNQIEKERNERLTQWSKGNASLPIRLHFNPTNKCNLRCKFCWKKNKEQKCSEEELPDEKILKLAEEARIFGIKEWFISGGGEPFFRPIVFELLKKIKKYDMYGDVITNGTLLDANSIKTLVEIKWDHMLFSLDGGDAKTQDYLRGVNGTFHKVMKHLKLFKEYKKQLEGDKPLIGLTTVVCNKNFNQIIDLIKIAHKYKCGAFYLNPLKGYNEYAEQFKLSEKQLRAFQAHVKKAKRIMEDYNLINNLDAFIEDVKVIDKSDNMSQILAKNRNEQFGFDQSPCYEPWYNIAVNQYGQTSICCEMVEENKTENVKDKSLREIWFGEPFNNIRKTLKKGILFERCLKCGVWQVKHTQKIQKLLI